MAKPIKDTPVLRGKDAKRFSEEIKKTEEKRPTASEFAKMNENFRKLQAIEGCHAIPR